jgi:hypothetical protein
MDHGFPRAPFRDGDDGQAARIRLERSQTKRLESAA